MLKTAKHLLLAAVAIAAAPAANAQITLADKGRPKARILLASETETNRRAATLLQRFVREIFGLCLPWHYGVGYPAWFFIDEVVVE